MDLEEDYIEYAAEFSLAMMAVTASYFFNPFTPVTYLSLLLIPVLFGYTALISHKGFRKSSLLASVSLLFVLLGGATAFIAGLIAVGNVLVSVFAGGRRFRDFYSTTTLPLLLTGLILGAASYGYAVNNSDVKQGIRDTAAKFAGEEIGPRIQEQLGGNIEQRQLQIVEATSRNTVRATEGYVLNRTQLEQREKQELSETFRSARDTVPERITNRVERQSENVTTDIPSRTEKVLKQNFTGKMLLLIIPLVAFGLYSLQPLVGLLTAVSATVFRRLES